MMQYLFEMNDAIPKANTRKCQSEHAQMSKRTRQPSKANERRNTAAFQSENKFRNTLDFQSEQVGIIRQVVVLKLKIICKFDNHYLIENVNLCKYLLT